MKIVFKNLTPSALARELVRERLGTVVEKFPALVDHRVTVTVEMENSPVHAGVDQFTVSTMVTGKRIRQLRLRKSATAFPLAVAELADGLNEYLSRELDRLRKGPRVNRNIRRMA